LGVKRASARKRRGTIIPIVPAKVWRQREGSRAYASATQSSSLSKHTSSTMGGKAGKTSESDAGKSPEKVGYLY